MLAFFRVWWARWRALFRRDGIADEIREEMQFHIAMRADEHVRRGASVNEARRIALRQFGNQTVLQDRGYDERGAPFWDGVRHDARGAVRALRHAPAFTIAVVVVLAVAIGASTAVYSIVDGVLLRQLPFDQSDRLVALLGTGGTGTFLPRIQTTTLQTFLDWRARQHSFDAVALDWHRSLEYRTQAGRPEDLPAEQVSADFFAILRIAPRAGRFFVRDDEAPGQHVVVLSDRFWRRELGAASDAIGRTLLLNGETWTIVGVAPAGFEYPVGDVRPADVFVPQAVRPVDAIRGKGRNYNGSVIGRLKAGVTLRQADVDMRAITHALDTQFPEWEPQRTVRVVSLRDAIVGDARPWMLALLATIGFVLAIACANVTSLVLVRATARTHDRAVRIALGAGRGRLMRGALIEGMLLAGLAAVLGVALASLAVSGLRSWLPAGVPRAAAIGVNGRVLTVEIFAACLVGLALGLAGATGAGGRVADALRSGGRALAGRSSGGLRHALVLLEVAVATVLLVGAGLFADSFARVMRVDLGFDYDHVIAIRSLGIGFDPTGAGRRWTWNPRESPVVLQRRTIEYLTTLQTVLRTVPGVASVAAVDGGVPVLGTWSSRDVSLPGGRTIPDGAIDRSRVTAAFLSVLRIPILRGRGVSDDDTRLASPVAVVSDMTARQLWPGEDPLGQHLVVEGREWRVVGVAGDVRGAGPEAPPRPQIYVPLAEDGISPSNVAVLVRTTGSADLTLPAVKAAIWSVNPDQRFQQETFTLARYFEGMIAPRRFNMALMAIFGAFGLVIAAIGVYGLLAFTVAERTREIGVRIALGASPGVVMFAVAKRLIIIVVGGLVFGGLVSWRVMALVKGFLFQIQPTDVRVFGGALLLLLIAAVVAATAPARRAVSIDPVIALRQE